jgi:ribose/xylose/arabinose/galactoside ABC-type transport system permease subunit
VSAVGEAFGRTVDAVRDAASESRRGWSPAASAVAAALALAAAMPLVVADPLRLAHLTGWLAFALAALGLGLVVGIGGLPSLAQGAFVGIGAFAAALLQARAGWPVAPAVLAAALAAASIGVVTGVGVVRVRPVFVAVSTWLLAWLVAIGLTVFPRVSGGADGIAVDVAPRPWLEYEVLLALVAVATGVFALFARGLPGICLAAVRQRYAAAAALGLPAARLRLTAFALAAGVGGLAGGLEVQVSGVPTRRPTIRCSRSSCSRPSCWAARRGRSGRSSAPRSSPSRGWRRGRSRRPERCAPSASRRSSRRSSSSRPSRSAGKERCRRSWRASAAGGPSRPAPESASAATRSRTRPSCGRRG